MGRLGTKKLTYQDAAWERMLAKLDEYRRQHGHCQVPLGSKRYRKLSTWVQHQRVLKRTGRLSAKRARHLRNFGFDWVSRGRSLEFRNSAYWTTKWDRMLARLATFQQRFGHCLVPVGWPGTPKLGQWVSRQRRLKQRGLLSKARQRKLEALGVEWTPADAAGPRWKRCFMKLMEFQS
ncbi:MAG: box helicase [Acidobacteria bacterium]|nr:box helicase [Acidobacteriota bacterium]